jgi:hypothetical protein
MKWALDLIQQLANIFVVQMGISSHPFGTNLKGLYLASLIAFF